MQKNKRVLIISVDPFNRENATGITLSNLFDGWNKNDIAQIYIADKTPSNDVCTYFFHLSASFSPIDYYLRKFLSVLKKQSKEIISVPAAVANVQKRNLKHSFHLNCRAIADYSLLILPQELCDWIAKFKPDVIYSMLGSVRMINLVSMIAHIAKVPILPHFMDDWTNTLYQQNELAGLARFCFEKKLISFFSLTRGGLCISQAMSEEYEKRYALPFYTFGNSVDDAFFCQPIKSVETKTLTILYVGGLHLNRWQSLLMVAQAIEKAEIHNKKILLKIYAPEKDLKLYCDYFKPFSNTECVGSLKSEAVFATLKKADVLLHIESFDENYALYTKYSLSTKIPQYMASGKPVLAFGPAVLASIAHIRETKAGFVICENNLHVLQNKIQTFLNDETLLFSCANNGFSYATHHYLKSNNSVLLQNILKNY